MSEEFKIPITPIRTLWEYIREEFEQEIAKKTGWGKNEIMMAFDKASTKALYKYAAYKGVNVD